MHELGLERPLPRDVPADHHVSDDFTGSVSARCNYQVHLALGAVFVAIDRMAGPRAALLDRLANRRRGAAGLRTAQQEVGPAAQHLLLFVARDLGECGIGVRDQAVPIGHHHRLCRLLHHSGQPVPLGLHCAPGFLPPYDLDLERDVLGQMLEKLHLDGPERVRHGRIHHQTADHAAFDLEWQRDRRLIATGLALRQPRAEIRVGNGVRNDHGLAGPERCPSHATSIGHIEHRHPNDVQIALDVPGRGHRQDVPALAVHEPQPGHAETTPLDRDTTGLAIELVTVLDSGNGAQDLGKGIS